MASMTLKTTPNIEVNGETTPDFVINQGDSQTSMSFKMTLDKIIWNYQFNTEGYIFYKSHVHGNHI